MPSLSLRVNQYDGVYQVGILGSSVNGFGRCALLCQVARPCQLHSVTLAPYLGFFSHSNMHQNLSRDEGFLQCEAKRSRLSFSRSLSLGELLL